MRREERGMHVEARRRRHHGMRSRLPSFDGPVKGALSCPRTPGHRPQGWCKVARWRPQFRPRPPARRPQAQGADRAGPPSAARGRPQADGRRRARTGERRRQGRARAGRPRRASARIHRVEALEGRKSPAHAAHARLDRRVAGRQARRALSPHRPAEDRSHGGDADDVERLRRALPHPAGRSQPHRRSPSRPPSRSSARGPTSSSRS